MVQWTISFTIGITYGSSNSDNINFPPLPGISYHHSPINLNCDPGWIRTNDIHLRRVALYPAELQNQYSDLSGVAAGSPIGQI
jgi:hypothetical protein